MPSSRTRANPPPTRTKRELASSPEDRKQFNATHGRTWHLPFMVVITIGLLLPFVNKAVHMDDPLFIAAARQIQQHPADFYGFHINWYGTPMPMHKVMINPPVMSCLLAVGASVVGWSEPALHALCMLSAVGVVLGTYAFARRCGIRPLTAAMATLVAPAFLVSSTTLMCDGTMLCFWVWAVVLWDVGLKSERAWAFAASGVLIGLAALTKYFGAALVPLLVLYSLVHSPRSARRMVWLLVPMAMLAAYHFWTANLYDRSLLLEAFSYSDEFRAQTGGRDWTAATITGLSFTGGCLLPILLLRACASSWRGWTVALGLCVMVGVALVTLRPWHAGAFSVVRHLHLTVFVAGGTLVLGWAIADFWRTRDAVNAVLLAWIAGTFVFAAFLNWTVAARSILPMAPAAAILAVRSMNNGVRAPWRTVTPLVAGIGLSLAVAWADTSFANQARTAADRIMSEYGTLGRTVWFQGHWGFQYAMEARGGKAIDVGNPYIAAGNVMVVPTTNSNVNQMMPDIPGRRVRLQFPVAPCLATVNMESGAGFYSSVVGPLPYAFGKIPPEAYEIYVLPGP